MSDYSAMELLFSAIEKPISQLTLCDFLPKKITRNQLFSSLQLVSGFNTPSWNGSSISLDVAHSL
jgi:hypothetical protein